MTELTRRRRLLILGTCCLSLLIVGLDITIVNVALRSIQVDLGASLSQLQWTIDAYTLVLASLLVLSGSMGDRLGRRRTFQTGLAIFVLGSLLCGLAPGLGWLIAFRIVQAVGGSMLNPVALSIIANVFTDTRERAFAIGVWGSVVGISVGLGPVVGGALIEAVGWRGIFWINVPIGIAAIILTALFVPESKAPRARPVDPPGQLLVILTLVSLTYAIIEAPHNGWGSAITLSLFAVSAAALSALLAVESRRADPLIELPFFRSAPFSGATVIAVFAFAAFGGFLFLNTLYLQEVRGYSPLLAGVCTLPLAIGPAFLAPLSGHLVGSRGTRIPLFAAGIGLTLGGFMLLGVGASTSIGWILLSYVVFSAGFGMVNAPITFSAVSGMPASRAGVAAALASTSRQVGSTVGIAVVGSLLNSGLGGRAVGGGFVDASRVAWWVLIACGVTVLAVGLVVSGRWARATADRTAEALVV